MIPNDEVSCHSLVQGMLRQLAGKDINIDNVVVLLVMPYDL